MESLTDVDGYGYALDYPDAMTQLDQKNSKEMKKLLENSSDLDAFIQTFPQIKNLVSQKEKLMKESKALAESNLSRKPVLYNDRNMLYRRKKEVAEYVEKIKRSRIRLIATFGHHNLDLLHSLLQVASMEAEEHSSRIADRSFDKETLSDKDIEEFLGSFVPIRKEFYVRAIKLEKCEERLGIKSQKPSIICSITPPISSTKKNSLFSQRSKSSSPKRRAPQPPVMKSIRKTTHPSRALAPARKAPPPPRSKSTSPIRPRKETKELY